MLGDFLITVVWLFFWTMALMIFFSVVMDIFRRDDLTGVMKAVWLIVTFWVPFLGCLIYMIVRPKVTAQDVQNIARADAAAKAAAGVSTADELTKLTQLRDANVISPAQYEALKAKLLADAGAPASAPAAPAS